MFITLPNLVLSCSRLASFDKAEPPVSVALLYFRGTARICFRLHVLKKLHHTARLEFITAVLLRIQASWGAVSCRMWNMYVGTYYQVTRRHRPEDCNLTTVKRACDGTRKDSFFLNFICRNVRCIQVLEAYNIATVKFSA